jgi:aconitase B
MYIEIAVAVNGDVTGIVSSMRSAVNVNVNVTGRAAQHEPVYFV